MEEYKGVDYLRRKLNAKQFKVKLRYQYYDMKAMVSDPSPIIPEKLKQNYKSVIGWCGRAVDCIADRLAFREFRDDNFGLNEIYAMNNPDVLFDNAILSALIASCSFIYITPDEDDYPRLQVIDGGNATGEIDAITGLLKEGYAVLERNEKGQVISDAYFVPGRTDYYIDGEEPYSIENAAPYPLLVPILFRPDASRPFGHSRISRACIDIQNKARNTITRSEVSAEFFSFPQRYVVGTDPNADPLEKWKVMVGMLLEITKDEDGDKPNIGTFTQQSMEPHLAQLREYAALFAGETGMTLDDLGFATENPSSAEAIKAAHENQRLTARKAQRTFGSGFLNAGYLAACIRDNTPYRRREFYRTKPVWEPIFEPDYSAFSTLGDGIQKIAQAAPGYIGADNLQDMLGIAPSSDPFPPAGEQE